MTHSSYKATAKDLIHALEVANRDTTRHFLHTNSAPEVGNLDKIKHIIHSNIKLDQDDINVAYALAASIGNKEIMEWFLKQNPKPDQDGVNAAFVSCLKKLRKEIKDLKKQTEEERGKLTKQTEMDKLEKQIEKEIEKQIKKENIHEDDNLCYAEHISQISSFSFSSLLLCFCSGSIVNCCA